MQNNMMSLIRLSICAALLTAGAAYAQDTTVPEPVVIDPVQAEAQQRLEQELSDTSLANKTAVDFPNRPSLGSLELAPLPGINEIEMTGPAPMEPSVSPKDLPSEQLLGRITTEVFQEMADLERGNTFLQLQIDKEKFKNALEEEKSKYRQKRLQEISDREEVVRSRIKWWQEQEQVRQELEQKEAAANALDKEIAEQEAYRDQLREDAQKRRDGLVAQNGEEVPGDEAQTDLTTAAPIFSETYTLIGVRGVKGDLTASLKDTNDDSVITVKKDDILPSGHVVKEITKDTVSVMYGNLADQISLVPVQ